jgi:hypothetical protein
MTNLEKLDEVIRLTVMAARSAEPTTIDYAELVERRNRLVHELRAALAGVAPAHGGNDGR